MFYFALFKILLFGGLLIWSSPGRCRCKPWTCWFEAKLCTGSKVEMTPARTAPPPKINLGLFWTWDFFEAEWPLKNSLKQVEYEKYWYKINQYENESLFFSLWYPLELGTFLIPLHHLDQVQSFPAFSIGKHHSLSLSASLNKYQCGLHSTKYKFIKKIRSKKCVR